LTENVPLFSEAEDSFAVGASRYWDAYPGIRESQPRIYVKFRPYGTELPFLALLDTGGHFCFLNRDVAALIRDQLTDRLREFVLRTAYGPIHGDLYLHTIELVAEEGESLEITSTVFVSPEWRGPSFLGYSGALEHLRFAIDPRKNRFYFGPAE